VDLSDRTALREAIDRIRARAGLVLDAKTEQAFFAGRMLTSVYYEKLGGPAPTEPALSRMLLVAESHLHQPDVNSFYDIFRAARYVPLTRILDRDLELLSVKATGWQSRFKRLVAAQEFDELESILFELCVGARYSSLPYVQEVIFIHEGKAPSPDLEVRLRFGSVFVECKKFDRMSDVTMQMRDGMRDATRKAIRVFKASGDSAIVEATLHCLPSEVDVREFEAAVRSAFRSRGAIISPLWNVTAEPVKPLDLQHAYKLVPSPDYFWHQYRYATSGPWQGLVEAIRGDYAGPSFLDELYQVIGIKWAVEDHQIVSRQTRLGFQRLFRGIEQLADLGDRTILHVCYDRTVSGPRAETLHRFLGEANKKKKEFSWVIFNELDIDVTLEGRYDFREHAHFAAGPKLFYSEPPVTQVFVTETLAAGGWELFGIGAELPPLD